MSIDPKVEKELAQLAIKLAANEKTKRPFLKAVKEVAPELYRSFPDQAIEDFREAEAERREKERLDAETAAVTARLAKQRKTLLKSYTEDQVKEIETGVMEKYGLADYEAAAKLYSADHAPVQQNGRQPTKYGATWELPKYDGLLENPVKAARDMAHRVIDELNAVRGR